MEQQRLLYLLERYGSNQATKEELKEFRQALLLDENKALFASLMENDLERHKDPDFDMAAYMELPEKVLTIDKGSPDIFDKATQPVYKVHFLRKWGWIAALFVLGLGIGIYFWSNTKKTDQIVVNKTTQRTADIAPGTERAILTLADGSKIMLDSAGNGMLAEQGSAQVIKSADGQITYNLKGKGVGGELMNTMSTPRGGQYKIVLPDGSQVWLNAASSITYPAVFTGKVRKVKVSGEVYMDVMQDIARPFVVDINEQLQVQVLGTSFNINSYADEGEIRTTLVNGSVKIEQDGRSALLKPGYQAIVASSSQQHNDKITIQPANIDQTLAWKNGLFNFAGMPLKTVMKQLERWYNIDVQYEGKIPDFRFDGGMKRGVKLSTIIRFLSSSGVAARLEGKTLIIGAN